MTPAVLAALGGLLLGAILGSFLATIVVRWPRSQSVAGGRSRCDSCGRTLSARDLVPLLSALVARGRCRTCSAAVDPVHWQVELLAALAGAVALALSPDPAGLAAAVFAWLLIPLAFLDWRHLWLPDRLVLLLALAGIAGGQMLGAAWHEQLIGALAGFAVLTAIGWAYRRVRGREGLGQGDPKLLGALGLWLGWQALAPLLLAAALAGILVALAARRGAGDQVAFGTMLAIAAWPLALLRLG